MRVIALRGGIGIQSLQGRPPRLGRRHQATVAIVGWDVTNHLTYVRSGGGRAKDEDRATPRTGTLPGVDDVGQVCSLMKRWHAYELKSSRPNDVAGWCVGR